LTIINGEAVTIKHLKFLSIIIKWNNKVWGFHYATFRIWWR